MQIQSSSRSKEHTKTGMAKTCILMSKTVLIILLAPPESPAVPSQTGEVHRQVLICSVQGQLLLSLARQGLLGVVGGPAHGPRVDVVQLRLPGA